MSQKYPKPVHAASIWIEGDKIFLDFDSHTVKIPLEKCSIETSSFGNPLARQLGWNSLLRILRDREIAMTAPSIAKRGAPVQHDVELMVKTFKEKQELEHKADKKLKEDLIAFLEKEGIL